MKRITLVFKDGELLAEKSDISALPKEIKIARHEGIVVHLPKNMQLLAPLHCIFLRSHDNSSSLRHKIILEENSQLTLIEEYAEEGLRPLASVTEISAELNLCAHARLHYYKIQDENLAATHHSQILLEQAEASTSHLFFVDCGSHAAKTTIKINLRRQEAACHVYGLYYLNHDAQTIKYYLQVEHAAPYSSSSMLFKGILNKKSQGLFQGKVHVHKDARFIKAHQANHNLLLSPYAEVSTQPQLEIYADEVKCSHGATVGQLDDEALFYLRSRGIPHALALQLMTQAFAEDILNKILDPGLRDYIQHRVHPHATV